MIRRRILGGLVCPFAVVLTTCATASPAGADVPGEGIVKEVIGGATGWAFDKVAEGVAKWVLSAVAFFVNGVLNFLKTAARPQVESAWFSGPGSPFATVRNIAVVLLVGFLLLGLLQGLLHGDAGGMVRRMAADLPLAVVGMVAVVTLTAKLLDLTDALSTAVLTNADGQAVKFLSGFGATVNGASQGFAAVVVGLVAVLAGFLLWVELLIRSALVYLMVAISPMAFAAMVWPAARGVLRRTVEILLALILSKLVICIALAVGVAALSGAGGAGGPEAGVGDEAAASMGTLFVGTALLVMAAFSPFILLKLIPVAETALVAQGISRSPARAAQTGFSTYYYGSSMTRLAGRSGATGQALGAGGGQEVGAAGAASGGAGAAAAAGPAALVAAGAAAGRAQIGKPVEAAEAATSPAGGSGSSNGQGKDAPPRSDSRSTPRPPYPPAPPQKTRPSDLDRLDGGPAS